MGRVTRWNWFLQVNPGWAGSPSVPPARLILVVLATLTGSSRFILVGLATLTGSSRYNRTTVLYTKYVHEFVLVLIQVELIQFKYWNRFTYISMYYNSYHVTDFTRNRMYQPWMQQSWISFSSSWTNTNYFPLQPKNWHNSTTPPPNKHLGLFWREKYPKFVLNATIGVKISTR